MFMLAASEVKANDVPDIIKSLSTEESSFIMKLIYRGFASPEKYNSGLLLAWHEQVYAYCNLPI